MKLPVISGQVDKMEESAQGRVWTGKDAASRGLVDAIGGFSRAVAIAKQKANIPQDRQVGFVFLLIIIVSCPIGFQINEQNRFLFFRNSLLYDYMVPK